MRMIITIAALLISITAARATALAPCQDCEALLRACLARAWWQVNVNQCHQHADGCKRWCALWDGLTRNRPRPDPWAATVKPH
jgi:hypothetical protein